MIKIEITKVTPGDIDQLQEIGRRTFAETFSSGNSEENMKNYLEKTFSTEQLKKELSDEDSSFYFAVLEDRVVGYLKTNTGKSQTELQDEKALEIERIYVLKEFHGKKVAPMLYGKALELAERAGVDYVWLGVWEENSRAIQFYRKNGFVEFDRHIFRLGDDEQTDIMMKLQIIN